MISARVWRAVAVLAALQLLIVVGIARADELSPTLRVLQAYPRFAGVWNPEKRETEHSDLEEDDVERAERLAAISAAIDAATPHAHERAVLLSVGWWESRWSSAVGAGDHLGDEGRARGYWQQWGLTEDATLEHQADRAIRLLRYHARRCGAPGLASGTSVRAAVSGYATGGRLCRWVGAEARVRSWRAALVRMGGAS